MVINSLIIFFQINKFAENNQKYKKKIDLVNLHRANNVFNSMFNKSK